VREQHTVTTEDVDTFPTMFMFSPPADRPQAWSLTFEAFTEALRGREADAPSEQWSSAISPGDTLSFVFTTSAGNKAEGMAGVEPNGVAIEDCTCAEAAEFAHWLQETVLPSQAAMHVNMTEGVEWEFPTIELPRAEVQELQNLLADRLRQILDHEEQHLG
jgi:hypothetical protein